MIRFWNNLLRLRLHINIPWLLLAAALCLMLLLSLLGGISITALAPLFDRVLSGQPFELPGTLPAFFAKHLAPLATRISQTARGPLLGRILVFIFLAVLLKCLFAYLQKCASSKFSLKVITALRQKVFAKFLHTTLASHQQQKTGDRLAHFTYDIHILNNCLQSPLPQFLLNGLQTVTFFCLALLINWRLTAISLFILPLLILPVVRIGRSVRKLSRRQQASVGAMNNAIKTILVNLPIVRAFTAENREKEIFDQELDNYFRIAYKNIRRQALLSQLTEIVTTLAGMLLIYFGYREIQAGQLTSGHFMVFLVALFGLFSPLKTVVASNAAMEQANAVFPRLFAVFDAEEEKNTGTRAISCLQREIRFTDTSFDYARKKVLDGISFCLPRGSRVGIVGESGAGKSTIINLLLRFFKPTGGTISLDGEPIGNYSLACYRRLFGLVSQEPLLFNGTIGENIAYARPEATTGEIAEAARIANLDNLINVLPEGLDTPVGEGGATLSGGEKQRLALARAVLADPEIFIFDEATSNLDSESERLVQVALDRITAGRTCLVIAHRLSTLRDCDQILVLENGRITEKGNHRELFNRRGRYRYLYDLQSRQRTEEDSAPADDPAGAP